MNSAATPPALKLVSERCTSRGSQGVISTAAPEAATIGIQAIKEGGNAYDAALRAALAETVLLPTKCGLAGDLVALCVINNASPVSLIAIGEAADGLQSAVAEAGGLPLTGGLSVGVPAAPSGYAELAGLGRLGLARAAQPAIEIARNGYAWSLINHRYAQAAQQTLREQNPNGTVYLPEGRLREAGSEIKLPGMSEALTEFQEMGANLFTGPIGDSLVKAVKDRGGCIEAEDLAKNAVQWTEPSSGLVRGRKLWATPAPTHGPSLLDALAGVEDSASKETLRLSIEVAIQERKAKAGDAAGDAGTSVVACADAEGNAVVLVHSISHPTFGSGIVLPDYDLILSNRAGRGFSKEAHHANLPGSGKRPVTTLHAWGIADHNGQQVLGATSGGENQMVWNAQVIDRLLHGIEPSLAALLPLWSRNTDGGVNLERGFTSDEGPTEGNPHTVPIWGLASGFQVLGTGTQILSATSDIRCIGGSAGL